MERLKVRENKYQSPFYDYGRDPNCTPSGITPGSTEPFLSKFTV